MKNLLIAVGTDAKETIARGLERDFNLTFCDSLDQFRDTLSERFDLIVCGPYFDGSRILDLLRYIAANVVSRNKPVLCLKAIDGELSSLDIDVIKQVALEIGVVEFIDLSETISEDGEEAALARVRDVISQLIAG